METNTTKMSLTESDNLCRSEKDAIHAAYDAKVAAVKAGIPLTDDVFAMVGELAEHACIRAAISKIEDARREALAEAQSRHMARIA